MLIKKFGTAYIILILLTSSLLAASVSSQADEPPTWNKSWSYSEEIKLPISTNNPNAKFQPIDIRMNFQKVCWAKNESMHSVRVCCWDGSAWHELESQIYDLEYVDSEHIKGCGLVFLVPKIANGKERYFVYYDDSEKPSLKYPDHVSIEDAYYYLEPISGVSVEGYYYKITEDGYCIYAVGQKGKVVYRQLSQCIIKEKPGTKEFGLMNSDGIASFSFSYQNGTGEEDEISSDQSLVSKEIFVDGNLMVEFGIVSESFGRDMRTTNIYKYYYCPSINKRICIHVKHEIFKEGKVRGIENLDGRYGALVSYKSTSQRIKMMRFGEILPYLHVYDENDNIREYKLSTNPESKEREWIISYKDDCDLGKDAWFSYDEGGTGKANGILFPSNENIVRYGTDERDGIQLKLTEKKYLDALGTKVSYASINFGRNSYEKGDVHDIVIPNDLVVEFDTEFFTTEHGGYKDVIAEGDMYRALIKFRCRSEDATFENKNIYTLTVIPRFSFGRLFFSYPWVLRAIGHTLPIIWVELYQGDSLVSSGATLKTFLGPPKIKFPKLASGEYTVKVYRRVGDKIKSYIGVDSVKIEGDATLYTYCTWEKNIKLTISDQHKSGIKDVEFIFYKNNTVVAKNITKTDGELAFKVPFNRFGYNLKAHYKGFTIYNKEITALQKKIDIDIGIYDLSINVKDKLDLPPGVDIKPFLTSSEMTAPQTITPEDVGMGNYVFKDLPSALYELEISYGSFLDKKTIDIPKIGDSIDIDFTANFDLSTELFDSRGNRINDDNLRLDIIRKGQIIFDSIEPNKIVSLPPSNYIINVYSTDGKLVGSKNIELTSDRDAKIVTLFEPTFPILITVLALISIGELVVLWLLKKISLNAFLKLIAMSLIILSLLQPWWALNASSDNPVAEKNTNMFIVPQTMIDRTVYNNKPYLELATIPEVFTNFLGVLLLIVCSGFVLLGLSFIPNVFLKRRFSLILISASILFLILVVSAFSMGMSKICEISLGGLEGNGTMSISLPNGKDTNMHASWGLGTGFYLCIVSAIIAAIAGLLDALRKGSWIRTFIERKRI